MGTVGLNFGSATSGQGFDVVSTVNQIVENLQSVETPWKAQLTALQNRDSALSNLGTGLSALIGDLQRLSDFNGVLANKTGSSSDTDVLELISATAAAVGGTHAVTVQNLAQTSSAASDAVGAFDVLSGAITFRIGSGPWETVKVGENGTAATLSGLSAAVNAANLGVRASVLTNADGSQRLSLMSETGGVAGQITIADSGSNPGSPTTLADTTAPDINPGLGLSTIQAGIDANFTVDGVHLTSASNAVSNAIAGVTFQLLSAAKAGSVSEPVQVVIANDTPSIESAISAFVSDYNATIQAINAQEGKDASGDAEPLDGTSVLAQLQQGLMSALGSCFGTGKIGSLVSLGITASPSADGTITLNSGVLSDALRQNFDAVVSFFQDANGFGAAFARTLENLGNSGGTGGAIALALKENSTQEKALENEISDQEALIAARKTSLTEELNLANQILQAIPQQINQVNEMYSAITGYNRNQNG